MKKYPINTEKAKMIADNDIGLIRELLEVFLSHHREQLSAIKEAIKTEDGHSLHYAAHQIKGALRNFAAEAAEESAYELEKCGKLNELHCVDEKVKKLEQELGVLADYYYNYDWEKDFIEEE
jgi:HPt (histidine-containing phosphotransfer) domain-containing protein